MNTSSPLLSEQLEEQRLAALEQLSLLDTPETESFDRITRLASMLFQVPISAMSLTDRTRQWFKSYHGVAHREIPRNGAPCGEVTDTQELLYMPDLLQVERYRDCPLAQAGIRFYAGAPLTTRHGHTLGAFCVLDNQPRQMSQEQLAQLKDMAAMIMSQVELQHEFGRIDPITALPNRHQLCADLEDLSHQVNSAHRVLLLMEIADLRHVNESVSVLGATYLEELLTTCARRIRSLLKKSLTLYHVGFASFALVIDETVDSWSDVVELLSDCIRPPVELGSSVVNVTAAYGAAPFDVSVETATTALQMATSAVHEARQNDVSSAMYNKATQAGHQRHFDILRCFRDSLAQNHHLHLLYQPRVDARTGLCLGAEALLRWNHPELGAVSPGEFIAIVEQTSLAGPLTQWVLTSAFEQIRRWKAAGRCLRLSINVSVRNLEESNFPDQVASAMSIYGVTANDIELEFTESAVIRNEGRVLRHLEQLRRLGLQLAIDDFGTGYSSLSYLRKLPAQVVKLDQSFIRAIDADEKAALLVAAMIRMSHDLGYRVVAEGVETKAAQLTLRELDCDELQGYFIARPLTADCFDDFLNCAVDPNISLGAAVA